MARCKVGEVWDSFINGNADGKFKIDSIDANGNFTGMHGSDTIQGECKGGLISYRRPGSGHYSGKYHGNDEIRGVRSKVARLKKRSVLAPDDEWVGTHT